MEEETSESVSFRNPSRHAVLFERKLISEQRTVSFFSHMVKVIRTYTYPPNIFTAAWSKRVFYCIPIMTVMEI